jgi:hypothetical protein
MIEAVGGPLSGENERCLLGLTVEAERFISREHERNAITRVFFAARTLATNPHVLPPIGHANIVMGLSSSSMSDCSSHPNATGMS